MITILHEANGYNMDTYIVSLVNTETMEDEKSLFKTQGEVIDYAVEKWFDIHYNKEKKYEWYYKDGEYNEDVIND